MSPRIPRTGIGAPTMAATDVIGNSPISFTDADGTQRVVPLAAFQLEGATPSIAPAWLGLFEASEQTTLLQLLKARIAGGELSPPPLPAPRPAMLVIATQPGEQ